MLIAAATLTSCNSDDDDTRAPKTEDIDNDPTGVTMKMKMKTEH